MHTMQVLDRLVAVNLDVRIWSGRKKLTPEDLALGNSVPPEDLVSLGSKRVCDPQALRVFQRLKHQAERVCLAGGMRFLGGFAVPEERAATVAAELDALGETFEEARRGFVAGYGRAIEDWVAQHPQWAEAIRRAVDPVSVVESRLAFGYQLYRVAPADEHGSLTETVLGFGDTLFREAALIARELDASFHGRDRLSRRALSTFRRVREKLGCLAFVDYRVQPVLDALEDWLARVPPEGPVTGALFNEGFGLMLLICDPQRMSDHGAGLLALRDLIPGPGDLPHTGGAVLASETDGSIDRDPDDEDPGEDLDDWAPAAGVPQEPASFYF